MPRAQKKRKRQTDENDQQLKKIIGKRFRLSRKSVKMTQAQLAQHLSISKASITAVESGKQYPRYDALIPMHRKFKININWILMGEGEMIAGTKLHIPTNCIELAHLMQVPEVEEEMLSKFAEVKLSFEKEIAALAETPG